MSMYLHALLMFCADPSIPSLEPNPTLFLTPFIIFALYLLCMIP